MTIPRYHRPVRWATVIALAGAFLTCSVAGAAPQPAAFDPDSDDWEGLSALRGLAQAHGVTIEAPGRLELWKVDPVDAILIVHPTRPPPATDLARFMREGGRLAIFDDYGQGQSLLRAFAIGRHAGMRPEADRRLRGNPRLGIATPPGSHPLTAGVEAVVLNHAQVLHHATLQPVLSIDGEAGAVALSGAVGAGRLVAMSDASVLINNMLQFAGNRRFAENLVDYLVGDRGGTLYLVTGDAEIRGRPGLAAPRDAVTAVREGLRRLSRLQLPGEAVWLTAWVVMVTSLLAAATALPRRARVSGPLGPVRSEVTAGFQGRVDFFAQAGRNLYGAAMAYKHEIESELVRALCLPPRPSRAQLLTALRARGVDPALANRADTLLQTLDALSLRRDQRPGPPRVSAQQLTSMVQDGSSVLAALEVESP